MANETVFRDKSIERISSPDQLNDYVKLSDPGIWFVLAAIVVILTGACIFGTVGNIDSTVPGVGISKGGRLTCLVKKEYGSRFGNEMKAKIDGSEYSASLHSDKPVTVEDTTDSYTLHIGNMQHGEWVYEIDVDGEFEDGSYEVELVTEEISPLSFLFGNNEK
ncbi:MAG: hypothetical protein K6G27_07150 [Lachnospiraceae bacterium]|nr:hypothetical protein [Lachnospiraceae bacterium]